MRRVLSFVRIWVRTTAAVDLSDYSRAVCFTCSSTSAGVCLCSATVCRVCSFARRAETLSSLILEALKLTRLLAF